jgi:hypothetical protein
MKKIFGNSRGQIMVLYAGIIATLLGAVALGSDVAVMYVNWLEAQKTADASAIAGASYLTGITYAGTVDPSCTGQPDDAQKAACTYAAKNGLTNTTTGSPIVTISYSEPTTTTLKVLVSETGFNYFFGKAVGLTTYDLTASATAQGPGNIQTDTNGLFPSGFQCTKPCSLANLNPGTTVKFGQKFVDGLAAGNWQWLSLVANGASTLSTNIQNGATGSYSIGDLLDSATGIKNGPVSTALGDRETKCQAVESQASPPFTDPCNGSNPTNIPANDPCLVVVPAVDFEGCTGNCTSLKIEGFALIYLELASTSATNITGCFVRGVAANTISSSTAIDLGGSVADALTQ